MYCVKCGKKNSDNSKFCTACGTKFQTLSESRLVKMRCSNCDGMLEYDADKEIMSCPFCGSKEIVLEADVVKIKRIENDANVKIKSIELQSKEREKTIDSETRIRLEELEAQKLEYENALILEKMKMRERKERHESTQLTILSIVIWVVVIIMFFVSIMIP